MTRRPIGYYVHHHGAGHRTRANAIVAAMDWPVTLLGTGIGDAGIDLSDDRASDNGFDGIDNAATRPDCLHYAPIDHEGVRRRIARMAQWIADHRPALLVVDVSVEIAMLARLASVPTIYVRLNGDRGDAAHCDAFRGADALLAPFHQALELPSTPMWVREKTCYFPGIVSMPSLDVPNARRVLVVMGRGGPPGDGDRIALAACACPDLQWRVIGPVTPPSNRPSNLDLAGWVEDPMREIAQAAIIIGAAGDGLVGAVTAADKPFICLPEDRPYDEQRATAQRLDALGAAVVLRNWPSVDQWPTLIRKAQAIPCSVRMALNDHNGAQRAGQWLTRRAANATGTLEKVA